MDHAHGVAQGGCRALLTGLTSMYPAALGLRPPKGPKKVSTDDGQEDMLRMYRERKR